MVVDDSDNSEASGKLEKPKFVTLKVKTNLIDTLNEFLIELLNNSDIKAILLPQELPDGQSVAHTLVTSPEGLAAGNLIAPVMPVNSAKLVSDITRLTPSTKRLAVVLRPCEHRALIELVKLKQASLDNLMIIGMECPGTFSVMDYADLINAGKSSPTELILTKLQGKSYTEKGITDPELRAACRVCEYFKPENADLSVDLFGIDLKKNAVIAVNTNTGEQVIEAAGLKLEDTFANQNAHDELVAKITEIRTKRTDELIAATKAEVQGLENLSTFFSKCISCHNCMTVCPICYCKECFFESSTFDYESEKYFKWSDRKGTLKMPIDMLLYHLGRFNHMVLSCVSCGMCEQGCPSNIPLSSIYKTIGRNAQNVFDYVPGRAVEEPIPVLTFQEDELEPR